MRLSAVRPIFVLVLGLLVVLPACGSKPVPASSAGQAAQPAYAPVMTIERFMRAVNQRDLNTMARLFGTREGPVTQTWSAKEVDERMKVLAEVLRHNDYAIGREDVVSGRRGEATQITVNITRGQRVVGVPFVLVRSARESDWLIENIALDKLTR
jgi:hypothetical protein